MLTQQRESTQTTASETSVEMQFNCCYCMPLRRFQITAALTHTYTKINRLISLLMLDLFALITGAASVVM